MSLETVGGPLIFFPRKKNSTPSSSRVCTRVQTRFQSPFIPYFLKSARETDVRELRNSSFSKGCHKRSKRKNREKKTA